MDKVMYPVWKDAGLGRDEFCQQLRGELAPALLATEGVGGLRLTVVDSHVEQAAYRRLETCQPLPDAVVSVYLDEAVERCSIDDLIGSRVERFTSYTVSEIVPLANLAHPAAGGERVYGLCQVVFLRRPERLDQARWQDLWLAQHTPVAIDTQATFGYRQNLVWASHGAPQFHAIIEENFPPGAMTSDLAFYGAKSAVELEQKRGAMMASCARFIDFDRIDVIPMSEYGFGV